MKFKYFFVNDPNNESMLGNLTWFVPSFDAVAHWVHKETPFCKYFR